MGTPLGEAPVEDQDHGPPVGSFLMPTKLRPPTVRQELLLRQGLLESLNLATSDKLTLVDAPAGWGKTTLIAGWVSTLSEDSYSWLSLDERDNDPRVFWTYVVESLRTADEGIGSAPLELLRVRGVPIAGAVLPALLRDVAALRTKITLVIDDYHVISNGQIHEDLEFFVEHLPPTLHLVLSTRSDPPLPLGRLRVRGEMTEIRAADLSFSREETEAFLNGILSLDLSLLDIARLHERTEGWAAGLYLAALSLRGRSDKKRFIEAFAGDDRHIVDYLSLEVLGRLSDEVCSFLLCTSILDRLSGPLCSAVTGRDNAHQLLVEMERWNLFLVPLDDKRRWFRYHHLFRDLLHHELEGTQSKLVSQLHRRASTWHRQQGFVDEAIRHAILGREFSVAHKLISEHWRDEFNQGRLGTVSAWLDALPADLVADSPELCLARAWILMDLGRPHAAGAWLNTGERCIESGTSSADSGALQSELAIARGVQLFKIGSTVAARNAAGNALESEPEETPLGRAVAFLIFGVTSYWNGHTTEAERALSQAESLARPVGNRLALAYALGYLATMEVDRGELRRAETLIGEAHPLTDVSEIGEHFVAMMVRLAGGRVHELTGRLSEARAAMERGVELSKRGAGLPERAYAMLVLSSLLLRLGNEVEAQRLVAEARRHIDRCSDPGILEQKINVAERMLRQRPRRTPKTVSQPFAQLSQRELGVLRLLSAELSQREIAAAQFVSYNTIKSHVRAIYRKLGVSNRGQAVRRARELGLL